MATRTIDQVLDTETQVHIDADKLLGGDAGANHVQRLADEVARLERGTGRYACPYCLEALYIRGSVERIYHFAHPKNPGAECPFRSGVNLPEEQWQALKYNGAKESEAHRQMKAWLSVSLRADENVTGDGVVEDARMTSWRDRAIWRKPDVRGSWRGKTLVFEIQLSSTFIPVIAARRQFYLQEGALLFWIFRDFVATEETLRFGERDVFYNNNSNIFSVDKESASASQREGEMKLWCRWREPRANGTALTFAWHKKLVGLSELTMDFPRQRAFYYDVEEAFLKAQAEVSAAAHAIRHQISNSSQYRQLPPPHRQCLEGARETWKRQIVAELRMQEDCEILPQELERAWVAADKCDYFEMRLSQDVAYEFVTRLLSSICPSAPETLEGREDLRTVISGILSLKRGRPTGLQAENLRQVEDLIFRRAESYYHVFRHAAYVYHRHSELGYGQEGTIANANSLMFESRRRSRLLALKRDFNEAFPLLFPELRTRIA